MSTAARRRNVIVFYTDQQRADSLGCMGSPYARTPHVDALAGRGVRYTRHYAANPVCMPSRASFFTGRTVPAHRVLDNGIFLPESELTMAEVFRRAGYSTAGVGKLHFQTYKSYPGDASRESMERWARGDYDGWSGPYYGFEEVRLTTAHGENVGGHYGRWREKHFPDLKLGAAISPSTEKYAQFHCYKSNLPLEAHYDTWVADNAIDVLNRFDRSKPFFLYVSFPDPHSPFTPPAPYSMMYDGVHFAPPHAVEGENESKPLPYREAMRTDPFPSDGGGRFFPGLTGAAYDQVLAHTYGMIALVDDCIGRVSAAVREAGLEDDTIFAFTSDHGDFLGDHHFLYKAQMPCRSLLNVPLIMAGPGVAAGITDEVSSNIDVMPTLLALCGVEVPDRVQGVRLPLPGEAARRPYAFEAGWSKAGRQYKHLTIYERDFRLSVFVHLGEGELYDLRSDPWEHRNLYDDPALRGVRERLTEALLRAAGEAEPAMPDVLTDW
jgi:arylsulfatase A-like enzyme